MLPRVPSSFCTSISTQKYDVFLSFRGEDTRKNFTGHLYAALTRSGIVTFWDNLKLEIGEAMTSELFKAIQESWCSVIVFSETYVFSSWCLDELAEILEQKNKRGHQVFPIFYDVDPSDLRKQTGKVEEAFLIHEERYKDNKNTTQRWRCVLTEVANLKGWHLNNRPESEFIRDIVKRISAKLCQTYSTIPNELVGMDSRLEELHSKIDIEEDDVRIVGICGMGGIGKTTLARVIYTQISSRFECKIFLNNVREVSEKCGIVSLQKQLLSQALSEESFNFFDVYEGSFFIYRSLSHKKVLIVIDDVDNIQHLKCLVGSRDWFGRGSRIIVTTRDEHLLQSYRVDDVYKPMTLNSNEALRLLSLKAFNSAFVLENDFIWLSECVVEYACGLPLALEVLGSFLCGRNASQWTSAIERLKSDSHKEIHERLQISFDGLGQTEKNIFLDIACFFKGEDKDFVMKILDGCEFYPDIGIDVLFKKCLITINEFNEVWMHDLLQEMGRKIVKQKSLDEPGRRCRLWEKCDFYHVLRKNTATERIEGMVLDHKTFKTGEYDREQKKTLNLSAESFLKMKKLRLLRMFGLSISPSHTHLSNELRLFEWHGYPLKSLPASFKPDKLVALIVPYSGIKQLWTEHIHLNNLKFVNLKGCQNLIKAPHFSTIPNLESLILEGCIKVKELHSSIGQLSGLVLLNLKDCRSLMSLPDTVNGLKSLKTLNLSGCSKIENLPQSLQQVESLEQLDLSSTAIRKLESFIFKFKNLKFLSLEKCSGVSPQLQVNLPYFFKKMRSGKPNSMALMLPPLSGLSSLTRLNLSGCNLEEGTIPSDICHLSFLRYLDLSGNNFLNLPAALSQLSNLSALLLSNCKCLKYVLDLQIKSLQIDGCTSLEAINVTTRGNSTEIVFINGVNCYRLVENNKTLAMLKRHLKLFARKRQPFSIGVPGSEIPKWFCKDYHTNFDYYKSSSLKIPLPANIQNDSEWVGVALCIILAPAFGDDTWGNNESLNVDWEPTLATHYIMSRNHLWLYYLCPDIIYPFLLEGKDEIEFSFENFVLNSLLPNNMEFSLKKLFVNNALPRIKKYGIRLLYEKDLEEIEDQHWYNTETCADFNGATGIKGALLKRKHNIYDSEEEAGPSETKEREPSKRLQKFFDFILRKKL